MKRSKKHELSAEVITGVLSFVARHNVMESIGALNNYGLREISVAGNGGGEEWVSKPEFGKERTKHHPKLLNSDRHKLTSEFASP